MAGSIGAERVDAAEERSGGAGSARSARAREWSGALACVDPGQLTREARLFEGAVIPWNRLRRVDSMMRSWFGPVPDRWVELIVQARTELCP